MSPRHPSPIALSSVRARIGRRSILAAGAGLLLAACSLPLQSARPVVQEAPVPLVAPRVITIDAADFTFQAPETIEGGAVTFRLTNSGHEAHHAQLLRLKDGVTLEQFMAALPQGEAAFISLITAEGGPSVIGHHGVSEVTLDLRPGDYVLACFIPSADGVPHIAKGMLKPLRVTTPAVAAALPVAAATLTLHDFSFTMPATLPAGRHTYRVVNEGQQWHELVVLRLAPGKTLADVQTFMMQMAGPPPFTWAGGMQGLEPKAAGLMTLDLPPGEYVAVCQIPDPASGKPHTHLGMTAPFTIR